MNATPDIRLTPVDESIFTDIDAGRFASREMYRLRLWAEYAQLVSGFDELICLDQLSFTPFDYQTRAAQIMLRHFRGRGMFCDEVGLGKTIEAGLVIKEYLARNIIQRLMVVTPASLVEQWREELAVKFGLTGFVTTADAEFRAAGSDAWEKFPLLIVSLATARRAEHRARLSQIPFDLVVLDEAHHLKNRNSASWKFVNELQRKYILLLTATPIENNLDELYSLITLLKPGQLKTPREFRRQFVVSGDPRKIVGGDKKVEETESTSGKKDTAARAVSASSVAKKSVRKEIQKAKPIPHKIAAPPKLLADYVEVYCDPADGTITAYMMRRQSEVAVRWWAMTDEGISVHCRCEKMWNCKSNGMVFRPSDDIERQMNLLLTRFREESNLPDKKTRYFQIRVGKPFDEKKLKIPSGWRDEALLETARNGFDELSKRQG